tara:strand:- start:6848 stop:7864 length:1017 start_codon:yes stop_codon:yes gene_type:complete
MSENKTSRYFKYAIGEIILVVIGILIALQINNWNEKTKNKISTNILLEELHSDLQLDLLKLQDIIEWGGRVDSIYDIHNNDSFPSLDIKAPKNVKYLNLGRYTYPMKLNELAYLKLVDNRGQLPKSYSKLVSSLDIFYSGYKSLLEGINIKFDNHIEQFERFRFSQPFFIDWKERQLTTEMLQFFHQNPDYKKYLYVNDELIDEYRGSCTFIANRITLLSYRIANAIKAKTPDETRVKIAYKQNELQQYKGTYETRSAESMLVFEPEATTLLGRTIRAKELFEEYYVMERIAKDTIRRAHFKNEFLVFKRNEKSEVIGLDTFVNNVLVHSGKKIVAND